MISVQLVDRLYREHGIITKVKNGIFVDFEDYIEKENAPAGTGGTNKKHQVNNNIKLNKNKAGVN